MEEMQTINKQILKILQITNNKRNINQNNSAILLTPKWQRWQKEKGRLLDGLQENRHTNTLLMEQWIGPAILESNLE